MLGLRLPRATGVSLLAGRHSDRRGATTTLLYGVTSFAVAYALFAVGSTSITVLGFAFVMAGTGIGVVERAQHAAVAALAPERLRGSAFGLLAAVQSAGNLAASATAGVLYTTVSPSWAFGLLAVMMMLAAAVLTASRLRHVSEHHTT